MEESDQHTVRAWAVDDKLDWISFVLTVAVVVEVGLAVAGEGAGGQGVRQVGMVEAQGIVFAAVGAQGGVGLGEAAVVLGAAVYGGYALFDRLGVAFEIAGSGEGGGDEKGEQ